MTTAETGRPRLNPFAFVADTGLRFSLLIVLIACASGRQWFSVAVNVFDLASPLRDCTAGEPLALGTLLRSDDLQHTAGACVFSFLQNAVLPGVPVGLALLAGATWLIYRAYPRWQVRRLRLERLDPDEAPEVSAALDALCRTAGLRQNPEFWWNPLDGRLLALAFGVGGHRRVALTGAVALQLHTDPAAFRAMLLHELAHIRNGDVGLAYLTLSIWWAFLATALLPYAASTLYAIFGRAQPQYTSELALAAAQIGLLALCVLPTRNAVLRARELYADARSFAWHRDIAGLSRVLDALAPIPRLRRLLSPHPAPSRRRRLIYDTDEMFRFSLWDAFGVGLCAGFAGLSLEAVTVGFLSDPAEASSPLGPIKLMLGFMTPALVVTPLAAGAVAIGAWRATFLTLLRGRKRTPLFGVAAACAAGGVVGGLVPFTAAMLLTAAGFGSATDLIDPVSISLPLLAILSLAFHLVVVLALTVALAAFLAWVEVTARCWLAVSLLGATPGPVFILGLTLCLIVATLWVAFVAPLAGMLAFMIYESGHSGLLVVLWYAMIATQILPFGPVAWFGVVALWVFPLSAALWPSRRAATSWAFLDAAPPSTPDLPALPVRLRRAVLLGLVGGVAAVLAAIWLPLPLTAASLQGLPDLPETDAVAHHLARLLTGVAAQGAVAVLTVLAIHRLAIPHAMCAAFVTGSLFLIGEVLHLRVSSHGQISFSSMAQVNLPLVLFDGALVALACASVACLLTATMRWLSARVWRYRPGYRPYRSGGEAA